MKNPHKILGIRKSSDISAARSKYINLAKKYHPDVTKLNLQVSETKMKEINDAFYLVKKTISRGVVLHRPKGRFTKSEIEELIERFIEGQSINKIGRDMKRKQRSIKKHLIDAGLMREEVFYDEPMKTASPNLSQLYGFILKITFLISLSFIMLVEPRTNILEMWIYILYEIFFSDI